MYQLLRKRLAGKKGFTLIELIVVIAIIAILAVVLIPRFAGFTTGARQRAALSEARSILTALEALDAEGRFPSGNDADIQAAVEGYLDKDLEDGVLEHVSNAGGINFTYTRKFGSSAPVVVTCAGGVLSDPASPTTT